MSIESFGITPESEERIKEVNEYLTRELEHAQECMDEGHISNAQDTLSAIEVWLKGLGEERGDIDQTLLEKKKRLENEFHEQEEEPDEDYDDRSDEDEL